MFTVATQAQLEASIWYFGRNAGLDFRSGAPTALTDGALATDEGCASIADGFGNLLLYTDGITVWNRNHQIMPNGTGLLGHDNSTQTALIVPQPNTPNIYYIFTVDAQAGPNGMHYSVVDMDLDGGLGDVTSVKNVRLMVQSNERLTAVQHSNGTDIWLIAHPWDSNDIYAYAISDTVLNPTPVRSPTPLRFENPPNSTGTNASVGQMKVSPDGSKLALCSDTMGVFLFDFDSATGTIGNMRQISPRLNAYGVEFSPSSNRLYATITVPRSYNHELFQYNLQALDIPASETLIGYEFGIGFALQLGIDGKIYGATGSRDFLYSIENPNALGTACNFVYRSVDLGGRVARGGLPPFIQSFFNVELDIRNLCLGDVTEFYANPSEPIVSVLWDFGDGTTATVENPTHTYAAPGDYTVTLRVTSASGTQEDSMEITIAEIPVAYAPAPQEVCHNTENYPLDLTTQDAAILNGQDPLQFTVQYFATQKDADDLTHVLDTDQVLGYGSTTFYARVSNILRPLCYDTSSFSILVKRQPVPAAIPDLTICDDDGDGFHTFDLDAMRTDLLANETPVFSAVTFHPNQADADGNTNPLPGSFTNTLPVETIYFRMENPTHTECYETGAIRLEVIDQVIANSPTDMEYCDDDNDGEAVFDLTQTKAEIIGTQNASTLSITYHATQADADTGTNALNETAYLSVGYQNTIYARVTNDSDASCYAMTSFQLLIFDTPLAPTIPDGLVCDDNNDGIFTFNLNEKRVEILDGNTDYSVSFHHTLNVADLGQNALADTFQNTVNPETLFFRIENNNNAHCFSTGSFVLEVLDVPTAHTAADIIICDEAETGSYTFDLSPKDAEILNGQDAKVYLVSYHRSELEALNNDNPVSKTDYQNTALTETLWARVQHSRLETCYDVSAFMLTVNPLPVATLEETYVICPDDPELVIDAGTFETYAWRDAQDNLLSNEASLAIEALGNYSLTVTQTANGLTCERTSNFEVLSSGAPESFTVQTDGTSDIIVLTIDAMGIGDFEYSIDGINFQPDNVFEVFPGSYTVYVRDPLECRVLDRDIVVMGYQKFFSPNGDNTNDLWNIIGGEQYPNSQVYIFDRYGKLLQQISPTGRGWDGMYQGNPLPASDYWFRYEYDEGKILTGHFALKR